MANHEDMAYCIHVSRFQLRRFSDWRGFCADGEVMYFKEQLKDWKTWALMAFVAMLISVTIRLSYEVFSGNAEHVEQTEKAHAVFDDRLTRLELGKVASTAKRYTADDHAEYAKHIDARFEAMEKRHAAHIAQVSAERIAHDQKCKMRWDDVALLKARVSMLEAAK